MNVLRALGAIAREEEEGLPLNGSNSVLPVAVQRIESHRP